MASRSGELNKLTAFLLYCPEGRGRRNGLDNRRPAWSGQRAVLNFPALLSRSQRASDATISSW